MWMDQQQADKRDTEKRERKPVFPLLGRVSGFDTDFGQWSAGSPASNAFQILQLSMLLAPAPTE